jgi:hypothetical protein
MERDFAFLFRWYGSVFTNLLSMLSVVNCKEGFFKVRKLKFLEDKRIIFKF